MGTFTKLPLPLLCDVSLNESMRLTSAAGGSLFVFVFFLEVSTPFKAINISLLCSRVFNPVCLSKIAKKKVSRSGGVFFTRFNHFKGTHFSSAFSAFHASRLFQCVGRILEKITSQICKNMILFFPNVQRAHVLSNAAHFSASGFLSSKKSLCTPLHSD